MKTLKIIIASLFLLTNFQSTAQCFTDIKCGAYHNIALKPDGSTWVWGAGLTGALGNSAETYEYLPILLTNNPTLKINCGKYNTFIIKTNGTLWGTGYNLSGELGVDSFESATFVLTQIGTANNWKDIAPNSDFTTALKTDNTIWAWGQNTSYQMGDGSCCSNRLSPGQIGTATDWKIIAASGVNSAFAIKNNGTLWGWGSNIAGLLGSNLVSGYPFPTQHNPDTNWASITLGTAHMLALKTNGTLWAWGAGGQGQTGDGLAPAVLRYEPLQIGTSTWKMVAAGANSSFGIKTDGTLWAWGQNDKGQLGIGAITADQFTPVQIGTANNWDKIAAGFEHAIALKIDGSLWAWGNNEYGQLGNGTTTSSYSPILIPITGCELGVNEFENIKNQMSIAPNPTKETTTISFESTTASTIEVYSLLGVKLASYNSSETKGNWELNTSTLPTGVYIVVMKNNNTIVSQKKLLKE